MCAILPARGNEHFRRFQTGARLKHLGRLGFEDPRFSFYLEVPQLASGEQNEVLEIDIMGSRGLGTARDALILP